MSTFSEIRGGTAVLATLLSSHRMGADDDRHAPLQTRDGSVRFISRIAPSRRRGRDGRRRAERGSNHISHRPTADGARRKVHRQSWFS